MAIALPTNIAATDAANLTKTDHESHHDAIHTAINDATTGFASDANLTAHTGGTDPHGDRAYAASIANQAAELAYAELTVSTVAMTALESANGTDVATLSVTVTADGTSPIVLKFEGLAAVAGTGAANQLAIIRVLEGNTEIFRWAETIDSSATVYRNVSRSHRFVPVSGSHTYKINVALGVTGTSVTLFCSNSGVSGANPQGNHNVWSLSASKS